MQRNAVAVAVVTAGLFIGLCAPGAEVKAGPEAKPGAGIQATNSPWTSARFFSRSGVFSVPAHEVSLGPDGGSGPWDMTRNRGNFTLFDAVSNVEVTAEGALAFTLTGKKGTVGWGDCGGTQPKEKRVALWPNDFTLRLDVRQSADHPTSLAVRFWPSGGRDRADRQTLSGTEWQTLSIPVSVAMPLRHGFQFDIEGASGARIEFKNLCIVRSENQGTFRKEITLPPGAVWRAVAEVGGQTRLYVNGREVPSPTDMRPFGGYGSSESVFLTDYFEPGQVNCVGVSGRRVGSPQAEPYICMQGSVIMQSGERIPLDTDATWKFSREAPAGWDRPGFDDAAWRPVAKDRREWAKGDAFLDSAVRLLVYKQNRDMPVEDGYVHLENPQDTQLYYTDQADMVCHAWIPDGLATRAPALEWVISRYADDEFKEIRRGRAGFDTNRPGSLGCVINGGRLPRGAYALKATLVAGDGAVLDDRVPEPFLVTGRLEMRETDGASYTQDMDLELEREIDLTNPADGPWTESEGGRQAAAPATDPNAGVHEPTIVERNGLTYRETRPAGGSIISYLVEFQHPGEFYLMELEYPNDRRRQMGVACSARYQGLTAPYSRTTASVCTGDRYPVTGRMQTLTWLYRPDPGSHSLNLVALGGTPAAGARLRFSHIKNGLPALRAPAAHTRWNGLLTERTKPDRFGIQWAPVSDDRQAVQRAQTAAPLDGPSLPVRARCRSLAQSLDAAEAFVRYMRFAGQNLHMMGNFQAHPNNSPAVVPDWSFPCARNRGSIRDLLARVLRDNGVDFYAFVEFAFTPKLLSLGRTQKPRPQSGFWDTAYLVEPDGAEYNTQWEGGYGFNFNHPEVRKTIFIAAEEITRIYRTLPNFKGLLWLSYLGGDFLPTYRGRLRRGAWTADEFTHYGYGDVTLREFEQDTGQKDPFSLDDPNRFGKRHEYLNAPGMRGRWLAWRAERMAGFFDELVRVIRAVRPDARCICHLDRLTQYEEEWRGSGLSFYDYMLANGYDGALFARNDAISLAHTMVGVLNKPYGGMNRGWDMSGGCPEQYAFFAAERNRSVHIRHDWLEIEQMAWHLPPRPNWPRHFQLTMMQQPDGYNTREVFARALIGADPDIVYYGFSDVCLLEGNEQPLREFNRVLRALPSDKFQPAADTGLGSNLAIRELRKDNDYWVYAVNPGYWPVSGEIVLEQAAAVVDAVSGRPAAAPGKDGRAVVRLELAPFGVAAFKTAAPAARLAGWQAQPRPGPETAWLEGVIEGTAKLLETPAARVTVLPEDEEYLRHTLAAARTHFQKGELAAALLAVSADRFWVLKTQYLEKGAKYVTDTERSEQTTTARRTVRAPVARPAPAVDGDPGDAAWQAAPVYEGFISADEMPAMARTSFQAVHDGAALYLLLRCADNQPDKIKRDARDESGVFKDDCVALFIRPDPSEPVYYQMGFSASGAKFDQKVRSGAKETASFAPPWEVKTAVTADGWLAEVKLPAASLDARLEPGSAWGFNVHRACRNGIVPPCSWSYSPGGWHDIERLGTLEFEPAGR